jgi:hypothetical protein
MHTCANTGTDSNRTRSGTRGGSTLGMNGNRERSRVEGAALKDADYFRRGDTTGRAPIFSEREFERRWSTLRAVYEVGIKGRIRVRIHQGILIVYSPIFPTFAAAGKSRRRRPRLFVRVLRGGRAAQRLASAGLLCHLSVY